MFLKRSLAIGVCAEHRALFRNTRLPRFLNSHHHPHVPEANEGREGPRTPAENSVAE